MYTAVIVDDEHSSAEGLKARILRINDKIDIVAIAPSIDAGYDAICDHSPDLVLLDVELLDGNCFDLLERFDQIDFKIIFTTAHDQYAIRAFKYSALDFLLKPIGPDELRDALDKAISDIDQRTKMEQVVSMKHNFNSENRKIAIGEVGKIRFIQVEQIISMEAVGNYTKISVRDDKDITASKNLGHFEDLLEENYFVRVHRSAIINMREVKEFIHSDSSIVMSNDQCITLSAKIKKRFLDMMLK